MTDSSDGSADTVISVHDSRLSQSLSTSDSLSAEDSSPAFESPKCEEQGTCNVMGNRLGGDKRKKKDDIPQEKTPEDKPKKRGKKSKGKSKRNSQTTEGDTSSGQGACASPSYSATKEKRKTKSKRPDVLADLGANPQASPLGSPESASGSQGAWSYDDESDVSTLGYSTPLLSTPQVQRYVLPKQAAPQQSSTERLEELGRSIEKHITDKLSDKPAEGGASAASSRAATDRKEKRNVKKKRALGQAVIDTDSFTLPLQDSKGVQPESRSPQAQRLNTGTEKISLRASQESPVSPWLRDDDTPVDEEQMDEMFISCIDLSYNLADICSEKEFTEYGSLDSKKHTKSDRDRAKETSLSPRIARKPIDGSVLTRSKDVPKMKAVDSRETPPKSDSSTSTLAEAGRDTVLEASELELTTERSFKETVKNSDAENTNITPKAKDLGKTKVESSQVRKDTCDKQQQTKKKTGKSKSQSKTKKNSRKETPAVPVTMTEPDIPTQSESSQRLEVTSTDVQTEALVRGHKREVHTDPDITSETVGIENGDEHQECKQDLSDNLKTSEKVDEHGNQDHNIIPAKVTECVVDVLESKLDENEGSNQNICETDNGRQITGEETVLTNNVICDLDSKKLAEVQGTKSFEGQADGENTKRNNTESVETTKPEDPAQASNVSDSLSPQEPASPKHVPPPSPSAMDALAEIDEDDEEALESLEENSQLKEVQLFGETVFKRLSSLVESQSQDEDNENRFKDFRDSDDIAQGDTDSPPVNLGSMALLDDDTCDNSKPSEEAEVRDNQINESHCEVLEETIVPGSVPTVEKNITDRFPENPDDGSQLSKCDVTEGDRKDDKDTDIADDGTLKRKKKRSGQKKGNKEQDKSKKDRQGNVVKKPEIPAELKQTENTEGSGVSKSNADEMKCEKKRKRDDSEKENTPTKRESQQIQEVIDAYGLGDILDVCVEKVPSKPKQDDYANIRPRYESDDYDEEDDDSDSSYNSESRSSGRPSTSSLELSSRRIPDIEETFSELLSVKHILEDLEDRTPTEERLPSFVNSDELRSPPECVNGRRSRMSPAITDRTESDLDISEQRDDISTDSMYADDEDDGVSEVLFSRSYSEPDGNEVVVSCTFYNTQHNNNTADSDDFWEDYSTADESFKQIEISADAASSTFQNARKQMHDIHQHLQDLRRQMEYLQEEVESATLTPEYSMDSEDKRPITE